MTALRTTVAAMLAAPAFGIWMLVEATIIFARMHDGPIHPGWEWMAAGGMPAGLGMAVLFGAVFCVAALFLAHLRRRFHGGRPVRASALFAPGVILLLAEAAACAMQLGKDGRWAIAATITVMLCGRLCALAVLWEAADGARHLHGLMRLLERFRYVILAAMAIVPVFFAPYVKVGITGDEPSYVQFASSMLHDGDLQFTTEEITENNAKSGVPLHYEPHINKLPDGRQIPRHFLGPALVYVPVIALCDLTALPIVPTARAMMLILYGLTLVMMANLAARLTGRWGPSLLATIVIGGSFPMIGMSYQLYPDPVVAFLVIASLLLLSPGFRPGGRVSTTAVGVIAAIGCIFPWFHSKFGLLSVLFFLLGLAFHGRWRRASLAWIFLMVAAGAALFFVVNIAVLGDFLWAQASPDYEPHYGLVAILVDGHSGLLPYMPWALALGIGLVALWRRTGGWRWATAVIGITVLIYVPTGALTWEGQATALRYLTPVVVAWTPLLAAAFLVSRSRQLFLVTAACAMPFLLLPYFFDDPMTAYMPSRQGMRWIVDYAIESFSWREVFPNFRWIDFGLRTPGAFLYGLITLGIAAIVMLAMMLSRRWGWTALAVVCLSVASTTALGRVFDNPNWTVTASRMFRRQCKQPAVMRHKGDVLRLQLPAALKPLERHSFAHIGEDERKIVSQDRGWLLFPAKDYEDWLSTGPGLRLPAGWYQFRIVGSVEVEDNATTPTYLKVVVQGLGSEEPPEFLREFQPGDKIGLVQGGWSELLIKGDLHPSERTGKLLFDLKRFGRLNVAYTRLEIDQIGPK